MSSIIVFVLFILLLYGYQTIRHKIEYVKKQSGKRPSTNLKKTYDIKTDYEPIENVKSNFITYQASNPTPMNYSQNITSEVEETHETFDLKKAIIYKDILEPKYKEY